MQASNTGCLHAHTNLSHIILQIFGIPAYLFIQFSFIYLLNWTNDCHIIYTCTFFRFAVACLLLLFNAGLGASNCGSTSNLYVVSSHLHVNATRVMGLRWEVWIIPTNLSNADFIINYCYYMLPTSSRSIKCSSYLGDRCANASFVDVIRLISRTGTSCTIYEMICFNFFIVECWRDKGFDALIVASSDFCDGNTCNWFGGIVPCNCSQLCRYSMLRP